jgi:hypothetical protein
MIQLRKLTVIAKNHSKVANELLKLVKVGDLSETGAAEQQWYLKG